MSAPKLVTGPVCVVCDRCRGALATDGSTVPVSRYTDPDNELPEGLVTGYPTVQHADAAAVMAAWKVDPGDYEPGEYMVNVNRDNGRHVCPECQKKERLQ